MHRLISLTAQQFANKYVLFIDGQHIAQPQINKENWDGMENPN